MKSDAEAMEDRIREHAYYMWEASGRPAGRDDEFWQRASEALALADQPRRPRRGTPSARPAARRGRKSGSSAA
jgi:Protein of unknown function (DUF2934)